MSNMTTMKVHMKSPQTVISSRGLASKHRFSHLRRLHRAPTSDHSFRRTPLEPGAGHSFDQIRVHPETATTQPAIGACPLKLASPAFCPFGGACHTCPVSMQSTLSVNQRKNRHGQIGNQVRDRVMRVPGSTASLGATTASKVQDISIERGMAPLGQIDEKTPLTEEEERRGIVVVGQSTPDGNSLGPTNPSNMVCLAPNRLIWVGGPGQNTATAATGRSRVTARLGSSPAEGSNCDCSCGLFRQYIRGYWRVGSSTAPKQYDIASCGNTITMNESSWTEEFEACNPGGPPISASCNRTYLDAPGFSAGLSDGTYVEMHLDLRYQMWDQCRGRPVATGDRRLRISGDRQPRTITFG